MMSPCLALRGGRGAAAPRASHSTRAGSRPGGVFGGGFVGHHPAMHAVHGCQGVYTEEGKGGKGGRGAQNKTRGGAVENHTAYSLV